MRGDMVICRDLLNHIPLSDGRRVLRNLIASGTPLIALSNNRGSGLNTDVDNQGGGGGALRTIDVELSPFGWG